MVWVCPMISQNHVIKRLYCFVSRTFWTVSHHRTKWGRQRHCASGDKMVIVCHVILKDHVIKALKSLITIFCKVTISRLKKPWRKHLPVCPMIAVTGHTVLRKKWWLKRTKTFVYPPINDVRKKNREKEKMKSKLQSFLRYTQTQKIPMKI